MTVHDTSAVPAESEYLPRVLRCVAAVCIGYGMLGAVDTVLYIANSGFVYSSRYGPFYYRAQRAMELVFGGLSVLLVVGSVALWRWKQWSRLTLVVWASLWIVLTVISNILWISYYVQQRSASTQPYLPSISYYIWTTFSNLLTRCAFPVLVLCILVQPQVARLWARVSGGFEVVPLASLASQGSRPT